MANKGKNANNGHDDGLLTIGDVASLLHIHPNTVRRWSECRVVKIMPHQ